MLQAETRVILNERIMLDEAQARAAQAETRQGEGDINTDDDDDDTAEYEHWHRREMARIARSACNEALIVPGCVGKSAQLGYVCWATLLKFCHAHACPDCQQCTWQCGNSLVDTTEA